MRCISYGFHACNEVRVGVAEGGTRRRYVEEEGAGTEKRFMICAAGEVGRSHKAENADQPVFTACPTEERGAWGIPGFVRRHWGSTVSDATDSTRRLERVAACRLASRARTVRISASGATAKCRGGRKRGRKAGVGGGVREAARNLAAA